jgi:predicted acyltransferase
LNFRIIWCCALLIGYWLLLLLFPSGHFGASDVFSREGNLTSYIDRLIMPGKLYLGNHDPEGILSTIPAISTALLGMFTGEFLMSHRLNDKPLKKVLFMALAAICLMIIGQVWNLFFPINKNLWTSSFVCFVGGLSLLLFTLFYLIIDVWNFRKWAFVFVVIGMNPITIYLAERIINFRSASKFFFGGLITLFPADWAPFLNGIAITTVGWVFLYILYRKKVFLKV